METIQAEATIEIAAPAQQVFDYLVDLSRHPEWVANVSKVTPLTDGPARVGSRYRASEGPPPVSTGRRILSMIPFIGGLIGGAKPYSEAEITAIEPGRRVAWSALLPKGEGAFNRVDWEIVLEPAAGGTRLIQRSIWKPPTRGARRMIAALGDGPGISGAMLQSLRRLKTRLEQAGAPVARPAAAS